MYSSSEPTNTIPPFGSNFIKRLSSSPDEPLSQVTASIPDIVGVEGLEPSAFGLKVRPSIQLTYTPVRLLDRDVHSFAVDVGCEVIVEVAYHTIEFGRFCEIAYEEKPARIERTHQ